MKMRGRGPGLPWRRALVVDEDISERCGRVADVGLAREGVQDLAGELLMVLG